MSYVQQKEMKKIYVNFIVRMTFFIHTICIVMARGTTLHLIVDGKDVLIYIDQDSRLDSKLF